jgi:hypothetical protein
MNEVLAGRELFSDAPADDERWLRIIFDEAGLDPAFTIRRTDADVLTSQLAAKLGWDSVSYDAPRQKRTAIHRERIVLKRMLAIGLCSGV